MDTKLWIEIGESKCFGSKHSFKGTSTGQSMPRTITTQWHCSNLQVGNEATSWTTAKWVVSVLKASELFKAVQNGSEKASPSNCHSLIVKLRDFVLHTVLTRCLTRFPAKSVIENGNRGVIGPFLGLIECYTESSPSALSFPASLVTQYTIVLTAHKNMQMSGGFASHSRALDPCSKGSLFVLRTPVCYGAVSTNGRNAGVEARMCLVDTRVNRAHFPMEHSPME
ncbi:MAG: hypothetical protein BYD32DRAFT_436313 [Podila humilis]|nr:MAG: hypothetical protein BYD32DRAFT_436313 [Podila humilis]